MKNPRVRGRPRELEGDHQVVSIFFPSALLKEVDSVRGKNSRSSFFREIIKKYVGG